MINKMEEGIKFLFNIDGYAEINAPCQDYKLLYMVLDALECPPDSGQQPRDDYNNEFFEYIYNEEKITIKLVNKFKKMIERQRNEIKKRLCK